MEINNNNINSRIASRLSQSTSVKNDTTNLPKEGIIKGEVVDLKGLAVKLLTSDGKYIQGKMTESDILTMGEQKMFEVFQENGQIKMRPITQEQNKAMQIKKALAELGILNSELDEAMASELMNNELPVNEKTLKDLGRLLKLFQAQGESGKTNTNTKVPTQNTANPQTLEIDSEAELELDENSNHTKMLLNEKNVDKGVFILKNEITINSKNTDLVTQFANKEVNIQSDLTSIENTIKTLDNPELKETLENIIKFNDQKGLTQDNVLSKTNLGNLQEIIKNVANNSNKADVENLLKDLGLSEKTNSLSEKFTIEDLLKLSKDDLKALLNDTNKDDLVNLIKSKKTDTDFSMKLNTGTLDEIDDFFEETTTKFEKLLQELQKRGDDTSKELFDKLVNTKDKMDFSNHIKTNIFLQLPLNINEHKTNGELTIFKDKRKKGTSEVSSALISLDTLNLGVFETFIQKHRNNVNLQFRLDNENVKKLVQENIEALHTTLSALRYNVESITFKTVEQSFSILNNENDLKDLQLNIHTNGLSTGFDARA